MGEGERWRKVRMTPELMDAIAEAAAGRDVTVEWGEPDAEGFYTPVLHDERGSTLRDAIRRRLDVEVDDEGRVTPAGDG